MLFVGFIWNAWFDNIDINELHFIKTFDWRKDFWEIKRSTAIKFPISTPTCFQFSLILMPRCSHCFPSTTKKAESAAHISEIEFQFWKEFRKSKLKFKALIYWDWLQFLSFGRRKINKRSTSEDCSVWLIIACKLQINLLAFKLVTQKVVTNANSIESYQLSVAFRALCLPLTHLAVSNAL